MKMTEEEFSKKEHMLCKYICQMFGDDVWNKL